jgi:molybdate/tungstate transport system substrate-binding protein
MDPDRRCGRRALLAAAGGAATALAGCSAGAASPVGLLAAGSLADALENGLRPAVDVDLRVETYGSAEAARLVAEGAKDPDLVSLADVALFEGPLHPDWLAEFATNALVVAYDPDSPGGRAVADAGPDGWYRPLLEGSVRFGRTDPDLDPLGYRTLFALELASDHYGTDADLRAAVPERDQLYPETQLLGGFETGAIEAAVVYRNMAVARGYEFLDLPAAVDLSDPSRASAYAEATYTLPGGRTVRGGPISYGSTVRRTEPRGAVVETFRRHVTGPYLTEFGFTVPENYPVYRGDVPDPLAA